MKVFSEELLKFEKIMVKSEFLKKKFSSVGVMEIEDLIVIRGILVAVLELVEAGILEEEILGGLLRWEF